MAVHDFHIVLVDQLSKKKERIQKFKETEDSRCIYQNELDKTCFQLDVVYGDFKDLTRKTASFGGAIKKETTSNKELAEELQKSIIRMFKKNETCTHFYR